MTLTFRDAELESSYEREAAPGRLRMLRFGFAGSILIWSIVAASVWSTGVPNAGATLTIILGIMAPLLLLFLVATRWAHRDWQRQWLGAIANAVAGVVALVTVDLSGAFDRAAVPGVLLVAVFSFICLGLRFVPAALATLVYVGVFSWMRMPRVGPPFLLVTDYVFVYLGTFTMGFGAYVIERAGREAFFERRKSDRLLLNILPPTIAARLRDDDSTLADRFDSATVMFCDLVGFTPRSATMTPAATVDLLNQLFTAFDDLAERYGLEKIKTIGDAYMVAGGVPERRDGHAEAVVAMGLEMLAVAARYQLDLRIGVHSGPVVAGVIGKRKFAYDLWGDTVNTASRMESHGVSGRVQVTQETWELVRASFDGEMRGEIDIKGKGTMRTWLVHARRSPQVQAGAGIGPVTDAAHARAP